MAATLGLALAAALVAYVGVSRIAPHGGAPAKVQAPIAQPPARAATVAQQAAAPTAPAGPAAHALAPSATTTLSLAKTVNSPQGVEPPARYPTPVAGHHEPVAETASSATSSRAVTGASAAPPLGDAPVDQAAIKVAVNQAADRATSCKQVGDPTGAAAVVVTFAPSGRATRAVVNGPPFAGTQTGGCIASAMRTASIPPFSGDLVNVRKTVVIQ
jgi:hypothetical protein